MSVLLLNCCLYSLIQAKQVFGYDFFLDQEIVEIRLKLVHLEMLDLIDVGINLNRF